MESLSPEFEKIINQFRSIGGEMALYNAKALLEEMAFLDKMTLDDEQDEIIIKCNLEKMSQAFFKDYEIIWHDPNVDSKENQQYLLELEKLCKVQTFTQWKEAEDYIKSAKTVCHVITSGKNGEILVKEIFSSKNVPKIITFCRAKDYHSIWAKDYEKTLCTETKIEDVISQIQKNLAEWQKNTSSLKSDLPAFAPIFDDQDKSQMNHLHHYLKVIPNFNNRTQAKKDFLDLSKKLYSGQRRAEKFIKEFEDTYTDYKMEAILNWYTRPSFLFRVINNCLRIATSDSIQWSRFLLKDIERAIKDQYQAKSKNFSGLLYRASYLSDKEWTSLKENVNREIEMHGFLSVSKENKIALKFMNEDPAQKVLITILVPKGPGEEEQGFAEMEAFSDVPKEQEILFNVRSRFTVLETQDKSQDLPYRHLVLFYGAQSLRKFVAEEKPILKFPIEKVETLFCSGCQALIAEMTEKLCFISLADLEGPIYCRSCLGNDTAAPFLCLTILEDELRYNIQGCVLINSSQTQIPLYGYKCSKCGDKNQKRYFVCADCGEREKRWCQKCFGNTLSCVEAEHIIVLESYPFSFWCEKMSENELRHLKFQDDLVQKYNHGFQQAKMFSEAHEYEKAIEYYSIYIQQNEIKGKDGKLGTSYNNLAEGYYHQGEYKKALEYYFESLDIYKSVYGENSPEVATSYTNIGSAYKGQGEYKKALEYHFKSRDIDKSNYGEDHPKIAKTYGYIGNLYQTQGKYKWALEYHEKALDIHKSIHGENHPDVALSYNNLGVVSNKQGEYKKALHYHSKALNVYKLVHGEIHPTVALCYNNLGGVSDNQREYKKALDYHLKALNVYKSVYGESHPEFAMSCNNIGSVLDKQGEYKKSLDYHLKALKIFESVNGENHPNVAISYNNLGLVSDHQEEYEKALNYYLKALDIEKLIYEENHPDIAASYNNIGMIYNVQGELIKAQEYLLKALNIFKKVHGENHPILAISYSNIGSIFDKKKEVEKALEYYFKAVDIRKSVYGENHSSLLTLFNTIGAIYNNQKEYNKALEYSFKSLNIRRSVNGDNHESVAVSYNNIAAIYAKQGEYNKALEYTLKFLEIGKSVYGEDHPQIAFSYKSVAIIYNRQAEYHKAAEYYYKFLEIGKRIYGENHPEIATTSYDVAFVYGMQGKYKKAVEYYLKALDIRKIHYGENDPRIATYYDTIASTYEKQEEYNQALEYYVKSLGILKSVHAEDHPKITTLRDKIHKITETCQNVKDVK